jgi:hypothetical protein
MRILESLTRSKRLPKVRQFAYEPRYYKEETEWLTPKNAPAETDKSSSEKRIRFRSAKPRHLSEKMTAAHADRMFYKRLQHQRATSNTRFVIILLIILLGVMWALLRVIGLG